MFDWVPIKLYTSVYYNITLVIVFITFLQSLSRPLHDKQNLTFIRVIGTLYFLFVLLYLGLRPIHGIFVDMKTYGRIFMRYKGGAPIYTGGDTFFHLFMKFCSWIMSAKAFFFLCGIIYVVPMLQFSKKYFGKFAYFGFLMFATSFSFWAYGTNGIRNGMGTSLFIWGLCFYNNKKWLMYVFFLLAFLIHSSLVIPIAAYVTVTFLVKKPNFIFYIWLICIPLSLIGGGFWTGFFGGLGLFEERTEAYLVSGEQFTDSFAMTGFRWDFLIYSATGIFAGWYFIIKKKLEDKFYIHLFGVYAISNAFWVLVIEAAFSNRFAYLSWFLLAPVVVYPIAKYEMMKNQYRTLGIIMLLYFMFTYYMFF